MKVQGTIIVFEDDRQERADEDQVVMPHVASALLEEGICDAEGLRLALQKAMQVCVQVHVPVGRHFRRIHVHDRFQHVKDDWALSDFALYLTLLNEGPNNPAAAYAQAYAICKAFLQKQ